MRVYVRNITSSHFAQGRGTQLCCAMQCDETPDKGS
jgi:hypothetical protein